MPDFPEKVFHQQSYTKTCPFTDAKIEVLHFRRAYFLKKCHLGKKIMKTWSWGKHGGSHEAWSSAKAEVGYR